MDVGRFKELLVAEMKANQRADESSININIVISFSITDNNDFKTIL